MGTAVQIVLASALGDPRGLEALARRVFGDGDRPAGWFERKLRREHVDPRLSPVAVRAGADARDPAAWVGYVLVGTPPSLRPAVRTAGTGVVAAARGAGIGGRLLAAAAELAAGAGHRRMEVLAEAAVAPFYRRHGLVPVGATVTALGFGCGGPPGPAPRWRSLAAGEHAPVQWLPEAWHGTEPAARGGLEWSTPAGRATAWVSREGTAWLVHRVVAPRAATLPTLAAALLRRLPAPDPVLLPLLPADAPATRELLQATGFTAAQRGVLLERSL